jgi:hypothetical protein
VRYADQPQLIAIIEAAILKRPLKPDRHAELLSGYHDEPFILFLLTNGLRVIRDDLVLPTPCYSKNYVPMQHSALVDVQLKSELAMNRILSSSDMETDWTHSIGGIYRPDSLPIPDIRIIHNFRGSINDAISYLKFRWATFDSLADLVTRNCFIARIDVKWYYRFFPLDPGDWRFTRFCWKMQTGESLSLYDMFCNFGLRHAGEAAHRYTMAILWILEQRFNVTSVVALMDDFAVVHSEEAACNQSYRIICSLLVHLGLVISSDPNKTHSAAQNCIWSGFSINTPALSVTIKPLKLAEMRDSIAFAASEDTWTVLLVRRLQGLVARASRVVTGGRLYSSGFIDLAAYCRDMPRHHHVRPLPYVRTQVLWWNRALDDTKFHGTAYLFKSSPMPFAYCQLHVRGKGRSGN